MWCILGKCVKMINRPNPNVATWLLLLCAIIQLAKTQDCPMPTKLNGKKDKILPSEEELEITCSEYVSENITRTTAWIYCDEGKLDPQIEEVCRTPAPSSKHNCIVPSIANGKLLKYPSDNPVTTSEVYKGTVTQLICNPDYVEFHATLKINICDGVYWRRKFGTCQKNECKVSGLAVAAAKNSMGINFVVGESIPNGTFIEAWCGSGYENNKDIMCYNSQFVKKTNLRSIAPLCLYIDLEKPCHVDVFWITLTPATSVKTLTMKHNTTIQYTCSYGGDIEVRDLECINAQVYPPITCIKGCYINRDKVMSHWLVVQGNKTHVRKNDEGKMYVMPGKFFHVTCRLNLKPAYKQIDCDYRGKLKQKGPFCVTKLCRKPTNNPNVVWLSGHKPVRANDYGRYQCVPNYLPNNATRVNCGPQGEWVLTGDWCTTTRTLPKNDTIGPLDKIPITECRENYAYLGYLKHNLWFVNTTVQIPDKHKHVKLPFCARYCQTHTFCASFTIISRDRGKSFECQFSQTKPRESHVVVPAPFEQTYLFGNGCLNKSEWSTCKDTAPNSGKWKTCLDISKCKRKSFQDQCKKFCLTCVPAYTWLPNMLQTCKRPKYNDWTKIAYLNFSVIFHNDNNFPNVYPHGCMVYYKCQCWEATSTRTYGYTENQCINGKWYPDHIRHCDCPNNFIKAVTRNKDAVNYYQSSPSNGGIEYQKDFLKNISLIVVQKHSWVSPGDEAIVMYLVIFLKNGKALHLCWQNARACELADDANGLIIKFNLQMREWMIICLMDYRFRNHGTLRITGPTRTSAINDETKRQVGNNYYRALSSEKMINEYTGTYTCANTHGPNKPDGSHRFTRSGKLIFDTRIHTYDLNV